MLTPDCGTRVDDDGAGRDGNARRIRVSTTTRAVIDGRERRVSLVGLSSRSALLVTNEEVSALGSIVSLYLPVVGHDIEVLAGVQRIDKTPQGFAVAVLFMVTERETRQALHDLMRLLLEGDGGGSRAHPRVIYDTAIRYGPTLARPGRLGEISVRGAGIRIGDRLPVGETLKLSLPDFGSTAHLILTARVANQRLSPEGGYETGLEFILVDATTRGQLTNLLADLLCR